MAASATMALPSTGALLSHAVPKSPVSSLKPSPALPPLQHRSRVVYGIPGSANRTFLPGPSALFGGGGKPDEKKAEKKFITKDQEPEQYWTTEAERDGKNPMQTLLPYIALLTLLSPFAILAVAYTNGWIKLPN